MRKLLALFAPAVLLGLVACHEPAPAKTATVAAASSVESLSHRYLDSLFRAKPHLATFMGDHRFDGALPDLGNEAALRREKELIELDVEVRGVQATSLDDQIDANILKDAIALELLYLREIREWEWDPRLDDSFPYYDPREVIAGRLSDIMHGDFAPEAARRESVKAQLSAVPHFLAQVSASLASPKGKRKTSKIYCEHAIKGNSGRIEFFETEVKSFTKSDQGAEAARVAAVEALRRYQTFLEKQLLPIADGEWRLGKELYEKKFPLALQTDRTPSEAVAAADRAFKATRAELLAVARKLDRAGGKPGESDATVINRVKDELSKHHPEPADLVAAHARNLGKMRAFIQKHDLLGLPPEETLDVQPMPIFKRGSSGAEYLAPGILERRPTFRATYYVDPIDPSWPADRVESYLRGQNDYEVQLVAMHEAYAGHHTQFFYSRKNLNPLRAVLWNPAMVEGWAVYAEGQMVSLGWGDADNDRYRFYDLRGQMISCANTILDVKLQTGQMTDEEAVRFMVEEGFQERAMAEKKLLRAKLDSTQLAQYFLGLDEIRSTEAEYKKKVGASFRQRTFNEAMIDHGSIAVKLLRRYVLDAPPRRGPPSAAGK
jgi:uncharacterized protein (DUF885 family)